jgi:hypothetical protein
VYIECMRKAESRKIRLDHLKMKLGIIKPGSFLKPSDNHEDKDHPTDLYII